MLTENGSGSRVESIRRREMKTQIKLFNGGNAPKDFDTLNKALLFSSIHKVTGFIQIGRDSREAIQLRKGKRQAVNGKWISCCP